MHKTFSMRSGVALVTFLEHDSHTLGVFAIRVSRCKKEVVLLYLLVGFFCLFYGYVSRSMYIYDLCPP